jgi:ADP-heptose:LPS heptosyltransferase
MAVESRHILVIHIASLTETTLALPALQSLRSHFQNARIAIACNEMAADLIRLSKCADEVLPMARIRGLDLPGPRSLYQAARSLAEVRRGYYDLAIDLRTGAETGLVMYLAQPDQRIRSTTKALEAIFDKLTRFGASSPPMHLAHQYLKRLESLGVRPIESEPRVETDKTSDEQFEKLLRKNGLQLGEILVGIHPGARRNVPRWPLERFASIGARLIHNYNARALIFAGPHERRLAKRLVSMLPAKRAIAIESPRLRFFISAAARLSLFIGHRSGPAHVAAAAGAAVVAISPPAGDSSRNLLSSRAEHLQAPHPELILEEEVYAAACRLLRLNRADTLRSR